MLFIKCQFVAKLIAYSRDPYSNRASWIFEVSSCNTRFHGNVCFCCKIIPLRKMQSVDTFLSILYNMYIQEKCFATKRYNLVSGWGKIMPSCEELIIVKYYFCFGHFRDVWGSQTESCEGTNCLKHRVNSEKLLIRRWLCTYLKSWSEWHIPLLKNYEGHFEKVSKSPPVDESPLLIGSLGIWSKIWQSRGKSLCSKNFVISWPNLLRLKMLSTFEIAIILANTNYRINRVLHSSESQSVLLGDFTLSREPTKLQINTCERECVQQRHGRDVMCRAHPIHKSLVQQIKYPLL